jgi:SAM-dependent methyltransferase
MHLFTYTQRPSLETDFGITSEKYFRQMWECRTCGHVVSNSDLLQDGFYRDTYASGTYGDAFLKKYQQILDLPDEASDNMGRVRRILDFMATYPPANSSRRKALDVGAGLGVFPVKLQSEGWYCDAVEPNPMMIEHLKHVVHGDVFEGDLSTLSLTSNYNLVTLNKVIEHVEDPLELLRQAARFLASDGVIYVEVPDGPSAKKIGADREEFYIEHLHVFSGKSLIDCLREAGLDVLSIGHLVEPSSKFTIWAFARTRSASSLKYPAMPHI